MPDPNAALLRPLRNRIANLIARAVLQLVDDGKKQQLLQVGALAGETIDGVEYFQPYGFSAVPLPGAEAVLVFPNGDRGHAIAVSVADRRYRPTGGAPGEVTVYSNTGAKIVMLANGDIEVHPAPGGQVLVHDAGSAVALATKADIDALKSWAATHAHTGVTTGAGTSGPPGVAPPSASGTSVLKGE